MDIPKAQLVLPGDTVFTTGFDGVFPADVPVGFIVDVIGDAAEEFQTALVELGANFPTTRHVVWVNQQRAARLDSLILANTARP